MNEPYEIIESVESPSGIAIVVRGQTIPIGDRDGFSDEIWNAKLQSKANYFATVMDNA
jgi:hypothetical protein